MKMMSLWGLGLALLVVTANQVHASVCPEVISALSPCHDFLVGSDQSPTSSCCVSAQNLNSGATDQPKRTHLCECFQQLIYILGIKVDKAKQLPTLCSIHNAVPVDPNVDCTK
ncbi:hypothetical protein MANES_16G001900v8 [Manihot esculenta]|uniref:Bifunctional inhibitor/plant lipid transfer protein/seed storage helical domain-containing protein n=2 Tax=Manihot esculenta TaxID=3983 RepID=A0A2C9U7K1_MANES|nr:hypothetical protein MANES_16G001900v8 [Manihot esculenta]